MTIAVDMGRKATKTNKQTILSTPIVEDIQTYKGIILSQKTDEN